MEDDGVMQKKKQEEIINLVDSEDEAIQEKKSENEIKKQESPPKSRGYAAFARRNCYFLRIGKAIVLPLILLLHEPLSFTDVKFQELLSHLREMLPVHFGLFDDSNEGVLSTKSIDTSAPTVSRNGSFHFTYQFLPTIPRYCVMIKFRSSCYLNRQQSPNLQRDPFIVKNKKKGNAERQPPSQPEKKRKVDNVIGSECIMCGSTEFWRDETTGNLICQGCEKDKSKKESAAELTKDVIVLSDDEHSKDEKVERAVESENREQQVKEHLEDSEKVEGSQNTQEFVDSEEVEFVKEEKQEQNSEEEEIKYIGGGYDGFNICKYSLIVESIPTVDNDGEEWISKAANTISHYFGPRDPKPQKKSKSAKPPSAKKTTATKSKAAVSTRGRKKG